jgi:hypothetical protein
MDGKAKNLCESRILHVFLRLCCSCCEAFYDHTNSCRILSSYEDVRLSELCTNENVHIMNCTKSGKE